MARCSKLQKNDQSSIKYKWHPIGHVTSGLAEFVHEKSAPTAFSKSKEDESRKLQKKSHELLITNEIISAVDQIWDYASSPLGLFQPNENSNYNRSSYREGVSLSGLDGEALFSVNSGRVSVALRNSGQVPSIPQPWLDFTQVTQKISAVRHSSRSYYPPSFWRLLYGGDYVSKESLNGNGIASIDASCQPGSVYGSRHGMTPLGSKSEVGVKEIENKIDQFCLPIDTSSISGEETRLVADLATDAVYNHAPLISNNVHMDDREPLETNARTSLSSDYHLLVGEAEHIISRAPCSNLLADYHIDPSTSCFDGFEESHQKVDDHDLLENKQKQEKNFVIPERCKIEARALACDKTDTAHGKKKHAVAGALSGIFVSLCLHPVDTIKTVVQSCRVEQRSLWYIGNSIVSDRGLSGLYRGIATNLASSAPISAVYTFTYESVKGALLPLFSKEYCSFAHCVAGGCASIATSFIFTPSEHIKQQMQVGTQYHNCWNTFVGIISKGGLPSLYAGWGAVLCRNVPHSVVKFYSYESLKLLMVSSQQSSIQPSTLQTLVCGGLAGSTAAFFTTPFDVVKTRLQTQIPGSVSQYSSVIHALQEIGKNEGLKGLYRGLTPRLVMYMSQGALFFASYEFFKRSFSLEKPQPEAQRIRNQQKSESVPVSPSSFPLPASSTPPRLHGLHS